MITNELTLIFIGYEGVYTPILKWNKSQKNKAGHG